MGQNKKKKRGRPPADITNKFRAEMWYLAVKARGNWSDYELDLKFGYDKEDNKNDTPDGSARKRIFETIRTKRTLPSLGNHPKRNFDLVARVDKHPNFKGTSDIFHSAFWEIVSRRQISISETNEIVCHYFKKYNVLRLKQDQESMLRWISPRSEEAEFINELPTSEQYRLWLRVLIDKIPLNIDLLAFIGALYREAYLCGALEIALILSAEYVPLLEIIYGTVLDSRNRFRISHFCRRTYSSLAIFICSLARNLW